MDLTLIVVLVIALALFFDFTNGFHDTANAMATPIATGAMKPKVAVGIAAILNLVGAFLSTEVAKTISGGIIKEGDGGVLITPELIFAGLIGAIVWNMITWLLGLPSSSSHALFGGLDRRRDRRASACRRSTSAWCCRRSSCPALLAPLTAGLVAYTATKLAYAITRRYDGKPDGRDGFRYAQIFSCSLVALAHGTNDAQKTMGVITLTLISVGLAARRLAAPSSGSSPCCALAIALGTYIGGWRIIKTLGTGLTDVKPAQGFAAETVDGRDDPRLQPPRLRALDHPGRLGLGHRLGPRPPRLQGALGHGRPHRRRLAAHPARRPASWARSRRSSRSFGVVGIIIDTSSASP